MNPAADRTSPHAAPVLAVRQAAEAVSAPEEAAMLRGPVAYVRAFDVIGTGNGRATVTFQLPAREPGYQAQLVPGYATHYKLIARGAGLNLTTGLEAIPQGGKVSIADLIIGESLALEIGLYHLDGPNAVLDAYGTRTVPINPAKATVNVDMPLAPPVPIATAPRKDWVGGVRGAFTQTFLGQPGSAMEVEARAQVSNPACRPAFTVRAGTVGNPYAVGSAAMPTAETPAKIALPARSEASPIPLVVIYDNSACGSLPVAITVTVKPAPPPRPTPPPPPISRFDTDAEGWTSSGDPVSTSPTWSGSGGNPGGHIRNSDAGQGLTWYFDAPAKFRGTKFGLYGKTLSYDLKQNADDSQFGDHDIILEGNGRKLVYRFPIGPGTDWTHFAVALKESGWKSVSGQAEANASRADMEAALANIGRLRIRGEYRSGADSASLDNVFLGGMESPVPVPTPTPTPTLPQSLGLGSTFVWRVTPQGSV
jgi:hypothetical protein